VDVIQDNLVYQLSPREATDPDGLHAWFRQRACGFTDEQRQAVVAYLEWFRAEEEAAGPVGITPPQHLYRAVEYWAGPAPLRVEPAPR
jgi:hypothetical protein